MVPPELVRRVKSVFGCTFTTVYGQTESSPVVTQTRTDDSLEDLCETVGQPLAQTEISIRDPASNTVVPLRAVGEICARGYCVMLGYNDNPQATAAAIDAEVELEVNDCIQFADDSPNPSPDQLFAHAYATAVSNAPHELPGDPLHVL